ncbi:sporulation stage II protein R [Caldicellulosiruptor changbaiensis]|uniref:Sporulation stage II protein R n=1 Tax=Caldicellulosiruptor changbaiensis TaxID=1222016 RepID=A0A3T0D7C0_9FIRM|nr:stage II sporulation protein R [Caldicellulosiruptor changbaiensis]AZT90928.1 sporulation stage II protein R [Caldicellulosiruptor changbaiensis]
MVLSRKKIQRYLFAALFALLCFIFVYWYLSFRELNDLQNDLAHQVIRLHILANSNSKEDQGLKIYVRDKLISYLSDKVEYSKGKSYILRQISEQKPQIERYLQQQIAQKGYNYSVKVAIQRDLFPNRIYNGFLFPSGVYDAVKVFIGEGGGKNWWCVIFPPLCIVDEAKLELPDKAKKELKKSLTKKEYMIATNYSSIDKMPVKLKLKIYEILKTKFYKEAWFKRVFKNI